MGSTTFPRNAPWESGRWRMPALVLSLGLLAAWPSVGIAAGQRTAPPLTVTPRAVQPIPPQIPPPTAVTPGYPLTTFESSIPDGETRFLTPGPAEARCPGQTVVFVFGVVNPFRPTLPGDGAFMCRSDAVAEGYLPR